MRSTRCTGERGQSLVEFAMAFPLLLLFIGAIIMFGLAMHARSNLQQAVREAARQSAVGRPNAEVQDLAAGNSNSLLDPSNVQVCHPVDTDGSQGQVGDPVKVYITHNGGEGYEYTLVPTSGSVFNFLGMDPITVRMNPVAVSRLEKSVGSPTNCP